VWFDVCAQAAPVSAEELEKRKKRAEKFGLRKRHLIAVHLLSHRLRSILS
jgi:hypothetical protein